MASTNKTKNIGLSQFIGTDKPSWLTDYNNDMANIDKNSTPTGTISQFAGETAPEGYLLCQGQELNITTYQKLFNVIKNKFGGNGTTTFKLPDMNGKFPLAVSSKLGLGAIGGEEYHTLTAAEIPAHAHSYRVTNAYVQTGVNNIKCTDTVVSDWKATENAGGGQAHYNMPPFIALNYIIKF